MELEVKRYEEQSLRTFGKLYIDGEEICDTLEDTDRHLEDHLPDIDTLRSQKIYAKTAIPRGTYNIENYWWPKYKNYYPWLTGVPGFTGILIHGGMNEDHTSGCILVGTRQGDILVGSKSKMDKIRKYFEKYKYGKITIR
jgi:hypothetical protein